MKPIKITLSVAALSAAFVLASPAGAQTTTTTIQPMTSVGTVSEFSPDTITVRAGADANPVSYTATKTTTYVDDTGAPVSMDVVKSGLPVTVYYTESGGNMVASRVVVKRTTTTTPVAPVVEEKTTTTTTTTSGD